MTSALRGREIGVIGLGRSGAAAARLAISRGASVYASDAGTADALLAQAEQLRDLGAVVDTGGHDLQRLARCEFIVLSPGIPPSAAVLNEPVLAGKPIISELEFAFAELQAPVIGVTGTNGKTTVTALTTHLLREAGIDAVSGGNIGTALSEIAMRSEPPQVVVVEASSFQLSRIHNFKPLMGVLTNLAPDHQDWYDDVETYYADKARIFANAEPNSIWILNGEDERARNLPGNAPGERYYFYVGRDLPKRERGGWVDDGVLKVRTDGAEVEVLPIADLRLLGAHNHANALAAVLAGHLFGVEIPKLAAGLRGFGALPHRMQPVAEIDGVLWINDSKATNVASTLVALRSLDRDAVVLLGGHDKGESFDHLIPAMTRVKHVLAFGEAGPRITRELTGKVSIEEVSGKLDAVVTRARELASSGEAVVLSPACSSYDMFRDYEERGERFRELVTSDPS